LYVVVYLCRFCLEKRPSAGLLFVVHLSFLILMVPRGYVSMEPHTPMGPLPYAGKEMNNMGD